MNARNTTVKITLQTKNDCNSLTTWEQDYLISELQVKVQESTPSIYVNLANEIMEGWSELWEEICIYQRK